MPHRGLWSFHGERDVKRAGLPRALVVGAGMSGVVAARLLHDTGFAVTVLEARNRLGGRIWTDESLGVPCDLGASWIHGAEDNPLTVWCRNRGIPLAMPSEEGSCVWVRGHRVRLRSLLWQARAGVARAGLAFAAAYARLHLGRSLGHDGDLSVGQVLRPYLQDARLRPLDRAVLRWMVGMVESVYGAPADELSLRALDPGELRGTNAVPAGGYRRLIEDAARGPDIRLNTPVRALAYGPDGVVAHTDAGPFAADLAVITVPLGVLREGGIGFDPPLELRRQEAMARVGYGGRAVLNKVVLRFRTRFWPKGCQRLVVLPEDEERRGCFGIWIDKEHLTGVPVLEGFLSGVVAAAWDADTCDEALCEAALAALRRAFPAVPDPVGYQVTRWLSDPWARGSYSFERVGGRKGDREQIARPVADRLYFGGEATHPEHYGTVQGALLSGERAALEVHNRWCCAEGRTGHLPWRRK